MLALLAPSRRAPHAKTPRSIALYLERLEDRLSPSGMEMISLYATYQPNREVILRGQLTGPSGPLANQTVNLGGVVNSTATTDAQGYYSTTLTVSQLGQVTATSADGQSNTAATTLAAGSPTISRFSAIPQGGGLWLFTGQVMGAPVQGEVIRFDGLTALADKTCNVNMDGSFSYCCYVANGQGGVAVAEAVDWWGDTSNDATATVVC